MNILEFISDNLWIGIIVVAIIVLFLLILNFRDRTKCPKCKSKNLSSNFGVKYDFKCNNCGNQFNKK